MIKRTGFLLLVFVMALAASLPSLAEESGAGTEHPQIRAFWVDAFHDGAKTPAQIDKLVQDCRLANVNTVFVQVRRRGDAYYNLTIEPRTEDPVLPGGFDALQYLIDTAHAAGIEVHAWLNTLVAWNSETPPGDPEHIWNLHGPAASGPETWVSYYRKYNASSKAWSDDVYPSYYIDPGHPDALEHTVEVYLNIVRNYNVDGIHLDYSRYAGSGWGYNSTSLARFNARYGTAGMPAPDDPRFSDWRREQTAALVRKIYLKAIAIKPGIKVSSATIAWGTGPIEDADWVKSRAYAEVFQDWDGWLKEGILDLALPMDYFREWVPDQKLWYDLWIEWHKNHQYGRQVVIGPGVYMQYPEQGIDQIRRALTPSAKGNYAAGVCLYAYSSANLYSSDDLSDATRPPATRMPRQPHNYLPAMNDFFYHWLANDGGYGDPRDGSAYYNIPAVFREPAPIPEMPWKTRPEKGHLMGIVVDATGKAYDHMKVTIDGPEGQTREVFTDGRGWFGAADLPPGQYRVRIADDGLTGRLLMNVWIKPGQVLEANFTQFWPKEYLGLDD